MNDISPSQFAVVMRGYDRGQVEARLGQLERSLREARSRVEDLDSRSLKLAGELSEAHRQLREGDRPSYTGVGSRIEQLLRLAEEQSSEVMTQATAEAEELRTQARLEVAEERATASREVREALDGSGTQADALLADAQHRAQEMVQAAQQHAAQLVAAAEQEADGVRGAARHEADVVRAEAERQRADLDGHLVKARTEAEAVVAEGRHHAEEMVAQARTHTERVLAAAREEAERSRDTVRREVDDLTRQRDSITDHLDQLRVLLGGVPTSPASPAALPGAGERGELTGGPSGRGDHRADGGRPQADDHEVVDVRDVVDGEIDEQGDEATEPVRHR